MEDQTLLDPLISSIHTVYPHRAVRDCFKQHALMASGRTPYESRRLADQPRFPVPLSRVPQPKATPAIKLARTAGSACKGGCRTESRVGCSIFHNGSLLIRSVKVSCCAFALERLLDTKSVPERGENIQGAILVLICVCKQGRDSSQKPDEPIRPVRGIQTVMQECLRYYCSWRTHCCRKTAMRNEFLPPMET